MNQYACIGLLFIAAILLAVKFARDAEQSRQREADDRFIAGVARLAAQQESRHRNHSIPRRLNEWWGERGEW